MLEDILKLFNPAPSNTSKMDQSIQAMIDAYSGDKGDFASKSFKRDIGLFSDAYTPENADILRGYLEKGMPDEAAITLPSQGITTLNTPSPSNEISNIISPVQTNQENVITNQLSDVTKSDPFVGEGIPFTNPGTQISQGLEDSPWWSKPFKSHEKTFYTPEGTPYSQSIQNYPRKFVGPLPEGSQRVSRLGDFSQRVAGKYATASEGIASKIGIFKPGQGFTQSMGGLGKVQQGMGILGGLAKEALQDKNPYRVSGQDLAGHGISMFSNLATGNLLGLGMDVFDLGKDVFGGAKLRKEEERRRQTEQRDIRHAVNLQNQKEREQLYAAKGMRIRYY